VLVMGMITGCMGGLMRDVVCNEVPLVLKQGELYVTCAFAGSLAAVLAGAGGLPPARPWLICAATVLTLRAGSLAFGWRLPVYRSDRRLQGERPFAYPVPMPRTRTIPDDRIFLPFNGFWMKAATVPCPSQALRLPPGLPHQRWCSAMAAVTAWSAPPGLRLGKG
jgi:hypothetical protein